MPVPESARGNPITTSAFEAPFETPIFPYGVGGIDLASPLDRIAVGRFSRLTNLTTLPNQPGALTARPGMTEVAQATGNFTSMSRFDDPQTASTYLWGVGGDLYMGTGGALVQIDTGYAVDDPFTFLPYHPALSGDPWLFVSNRSRMRKVRRDGLVLPVGNDAPTVAAVATLGTPHTTNVASFTSADATEGSLWTGTRGTDTNNVLVFGVTQSDQVDGSTFTVVPNLLTVTSGASYDSWWGLPFTRDLSIVGGVPASDADIFHLTLQMKNPAVIAEVRLYFVVSAVFGTTTVPGTVDSTTNSDFYMKSFRPGDFAVQLQAAASQVQAAGESKTIAERELSLQEQADRRGFTAVTDHEVQRVDADFMAPQDPAKKVSLQSGAVTTHITEFGTIGIPLSRGEFARFGNTPGRDWSTVTGMILYVRSITTTGADPFFSAYFLNPISFSLGEMYLLGGAGPNTIAPDTQSYDYRYTTYDPRTGDESNPSPVMADTAFLDSLRQEILVAPTAFGDAAYRQRFYRRGGVLTNDWYFAGVNASDGGVFTDTLSDLELAAADMLELDNYAPVPTVDDTGATILSQPLTVLLGPINGQLFGIGNPYEPGMIYASKPGHPDQWPPDLKHEVCGAGEELRNGVEYGGQIVVFSRDDCYIVYPNLIGSTGTTSLPAGCTRGLAGQWALVKAFGLIYFVASDGVFSTTGGPEDDISADIKPLFRGQTVNGYPPIDFTKDRNLRLAAFQNELYFSYEDTDNSQRVWVYAPTTQQWRSYDFAENVVAAYADEQANLLFWGLADRASTFTGTSDNGAAITCTARTGSWDWGRPREEKLFGDQLLDVDAQGVTLTLQNFLNTESVTNPAQAATAAAGRKRIIFDSFGTEPQKGRNLAVEVSWASAAAAPTLYLLGTSLTSQPDITINRVTNWDDLGRADQSWVYGITLDANTSGEDRTIVFERDYLGTITPMASLTINHDGRHKLKYSWAGVPANQVRIRPDNTCGAWMCFRADWLSYPEPPRIAGWDSYFENGWDRYVTGLDLYCDTEGQDKIVVVTMDGVILTDPATASPFFTVNATGKQVRHLTLQTMPPLRGHVLRLYATDANPGLLYDVRWHTVEEPSEQANWNQPFSIWGTQADKYLKALVFEIDTFGADKTVAVEVDGVVLTTLTVNTNGRLVQQLAFPQLLGRVFRVIPTDANPSRLYSLRPIFDEEPFSLTRWETQETDHGLGGFQSLIETMVTMKSSADVTLTVQTHVNQLGLVVTDVYTIPSTAGIKQMCFVPFVARKGVLFKYIFSAAGDFWLYRPESHVVVQPFVGGEPRIVHPWGDDDLDVTRSMTNASLAAARGGGGT